MVLDTIQRTAVVPVVVLDDAKDAIPTAKALLAGGVVSHHGCGGFHQGGQ